MLLQMKAHHQVRVPLNFPHSQLQLTTPLPTEELLFASCRQHNVDLLQETFSHLKDLKDPLSIGEFINKSRDPLGNTALHIAALRGSLDCLDLLLDQEGVEVDPKNRMEGDTPLHSAARLSTEEGAEGEAEAIISMLLEAGADPRY
jgi:ankyrin repeat protein